MKKALLASILGIAASAMTSFGQGHVYFDNYLTFNSTGAPLWANSPGTPLAVGSGATVQLWYQLGTAADPSATGTLLGTTTIGSGGTPAGYYNGGSLDVLNYVSGNISFNVVVGGTWTGKSTTLVLSSIPTGAGTPLELDIPSFVSVPVPEPSTFALAGLGSAALLIFRRRK